MPISSTALAPTAHAAPINERPISFVLMGHITYVNDYNNLLGETVKVGDTFTGTLTYNLDSIDSNTFSTVGDYWHYTEPYGMSVDINGLTFKTDPSNTYFLAEVGNGIPVGMSVEDAMVFRSYNNIFSVPSEDQHISWQMDDFSATALSNTDLPSSFNLSSWEQISGLTIEGSNGEAPAYFIRGIVDKVELARTSSYLESVQLQHRKDQYLDYYRRNIDYTIQRRASAVGKDIIASWKVDTNKGTFEWAFLKGTGWNSGNGSIYQPIDYFINPADYWNWNKNLDFYSLELILQGPDGTETHSFPVPPENGGWVTYLFEEPIPNLPLVANAGPDQTVYVGDVVNFDGSASYDPDGSIVKYAWDFDGNGVYDYIETPANASDGVFDGKTTYTYSIPGNYVVGLTVTDNKDVIATDTASISVQSLTQEFKAPYGFSEIYWWNTPEPLVNPGKLRGFSIVEPEANEFDGSFSMLGFVWGGLLGGYKDKNSPSQQAEFRSGQGITYIPAFSGNIKIEANINLNGSDGASAGPNIAALLTIIPKLGSLLDLPSKLRPGTGTLESEYYIAVTTTERTVPQENLFRDARVTSFPTFPHDDEKEYADESLKVEATIYVKKDIPLKIAAGVLSELKGWGNGGAAVNYQGKVESIKITPQL